MSSKDWTLPEEAFAWLEKFIQSSWTVVEFGSGQGSKRIAEMCSKLVSFEHDRHYVYADTEKHTYVYAPITNGWYDENAVWFYMPEKYDFIIVDGPTRRIGRKGILFATLLDVPMLIDDTYEASDDRKIAYNFSQRGKRKLLQYHVCKDKREFATIEFAE